MRTFFFSLIILGFFQLACNQKDDLTTATFRVKIIKEVCNDAILQLTDTSYKQYAENAFLFEGKLYDQVFFTRFSCEDRTKMQTLTSDLTGLVITIKLVNQTKSEPNCVTCAATLSSRPSKSQFIEVVGL
jgi:hypothetical protein